MKRVALIVGIALTLSGGTGNLRAHGGCYGFWPFWPLAVGAGIAIASIASAHSQASPVYVYEPPGYPYANGYAPAHPAPGSTPAPQSSVSGNPPAESSAADLTAWVPSSPGPGHWVPDPQPYSYDPAHGRNSTVAPVVPASQTNTVARSVGGVPVYTVVR